MVKIKKISQKIQHRWIKLRLQPIRVFCLHHVCAHYDEESMYLCDWMALSDFKNKITAMRREGYQFISLTDAYQHLQKDWIRRKKYAVLTFDDGYKSLLEVLPWLEEQQLPATLFINGKYLDGKSYRDTPKEEYLTHDELYALTSPLIEIGHHGWDHTSASQMSEEEFIQSLRLNNEAISKHPRYVPFWAYTYGIHNRSIDTILTYYGIKLVLVQGNKNYKLKDSSIDRELL